MRGVKVFLPVCFAFLAVGSLMLFHQGQDSSLGSSVVLAQGKTCPDVVKAALATANTKCTSTGRNKICYGNTALTAQAQPGVTNFTFAKPGDITTLESVRTIKLSALDATDNTWGIVLLRIQANLPDTAAGQNVTMLMFGDVGLTADDPSALLATPDAAATPAPTPSGSTKPMQAFYFRTGVGDPACDAAPRDGILVQSPQGSKQKVTLTADGVQLELGSTAFLQAQAGGEMTVSTLEGSVAVTAFGSTQTAAAGMRVRVPLDSNLVASGPPTPPETYDYGTMLALPVKNLPKAVTILVPKPPTNAVSGQWTAKVNIPTVSAPCSPAGATETVTVQTSGNTMWINGANESGILSGDGKGTYSGVVTSRETTSHMTFHFDSPTHGEGQGTFTGICSGTIQITVDKAA